MVRVDGFVLQMALKAPCLRQSGAEVIWYGGAAPADEIRFRIICSGASCVPYPLYASGHRPHNEAIATSDRGSMRWSVAGMVVSAVVCAVMPGTTQAIPASRWVAPESAVSGKQLPDDPQVVTDPAGDIAAVWKQLDRTGRWSVWATFRPAGGSWEPPTLLAKRLNASATVPRAAMDDDGNMVVVWCGAGAFHDVKAVWRTADGEWTRPATLLNTFIHADGVDVAVGPGGQATAIWWLGGEVWARIGTADGGWKPATYVDAGHLASVVMNARGDTGIVYVQGDSQTGQVGVVQRVAGQWTDPAYLSAAGSGPDGPASLDLSDNGSATAVWSTAVAQHPEAAYAAHQRAGGDWGEPVQVSPHQSNLTGAPRVAATGGDTATVVWAAATGSYNRAEASSLRTDGRWTKPRVLSLADGDAYTPVIAADTQGDVVAAWTSYKGDAVWQVQAAVRPAHQAWGHRDRVSDDAFEENVEPTLAINQKGLAVLMWWAAEPDAPFALRYSTAMVP